MKKYIQYRHDDWQVENPPLVTVRADLKGKHREHCLCFQDCPFFKPNTPENCPIAEDTFQNCVKHNIVTPMWECPRYPATP